MDTGITDDYILWIFSRLTEGNNHLYGFFSGGELAVTGGFAIYKISMPCLVDYVVILGSAGKI